MSRPLSRRDRAWNLKADGYSHRQIAKELGCSLTSVSRWLCPNYAAKQRTLKAAATRHRYATDPAFREQRFADVRAARARRKSS